MARTDVKPGRRGAKQTPPLDQNEAMEFQPYGNFLFIFIYIFFFANASTSADVCLQHNQFFFFAFETFLCTSRSAARCVGVWR